MFVKLIEKYLLFVLLFHGFELSLAKVKCYQCTIDDTENTCTSKEDRIQCTGESCYKAVAYRNTAVMIMKGCSDNVMDDCTNGPVDLAGFGHLNGRWCYCAKNFCNSSNRIKIHVLLLFTVVVLFMVISKK